MNQYSIEKVANAIIYFIDSDIEYFAKTKLMKLMYFSDKLHLEKYTRTIFNDTYLKLPFGPVASITLNTIDSINEFEREDFEEYVQIFLSNVILNEQYDGKIKKTTFEKKVDFKRELFSKSEIEVFDEIILKYKNYTAREISDFSHTLDEYINTDDNQVISKTAMAPMHKEYFEFITKEDSEFKEMLR